MTTPTHIPETPDLFDSVTAELVEARKFWLSARAAYRHSPNAYTHAAYDATKDYLDGLLDTFIVICPAP